MTCEFNQTLTYSTLFVHNYLTFARVAEVAVETRLIPNRTILAGQTFRLLCNMDVMGYSITWSLRGMVIRKSTTSDRELTFTVSDANHENEGRYQCIASSGYCAVNTSIFVNIEGTRS